MYIPRACLTVQGEASYYSVRAESGNEVQRGFCTRCGSPMFILADLVPDLQGVWAASLDAPAQFEPSVQVWCRSAQHWGALHPTLPRIAEAPTVEEFAMIVASTR
jgi:hypothetical protein